MPPPRPLIQPSVPAPDGFVWLSDAAAILAVSPHSLRRLVVQRQIPAIRVGNQGRGRLGTIAIATETVDGLRDVLEAQSVGVAS